MTFLSKLWTIFSGPSKPTTHVAAYLEPLRECPLCHHQLDGRHLVALMGQKISPSDGEGRFLNAFAQGQWDQVAHHVEWENDSDVWCAWVLRCPDATGRAVVLLYSPAAVFQDTAVHSLRTLDESEASTLTQAVREWIPAVRTVSY